MKEVRTKIKLYTDQIDKQINLLLDVANTIKNKVESGDKELCVKMVDSSKKIDSSIATVESLCSELDQIDEAAGIAIDELVLEQVKILTDAGSSPVSGTN
jgi:hypothetical protein